MPQEFQDALEELKTQSKRELLWHSRVITSITAIIFFIALVGYYAMGVSEVRSNNEKHLLYDSKFEKNEKNYDKLLEEISGIKIELAKMNESLKYRIKK